MLQSTANNEGLTFLPNAVFHILPRFGRTKHRPLHDLLRSIWNWLKAFSIKASESRDNRCIKSNMEVVVYLFQQNDLNITEWIYEDMCIFSAIKVYINKIGYMTRFKTFLLCKISRFYWVIYKIEETKTSSSKA